MPFVTFDRFRCIPMDVALARFIICPTDVYGLMHKRFWQVDQYLMAAFIFSCCEREVTGKLMQCC